jgi:hypothetical protein
LFFHLRIGVLEKDILHKINKINPLDFKSTFFRYPKTGEYIQDMRKSSVRQKSTEDIINSMNKKEGKCVKALLLVDNIVDSFYINVFPDLNKNFIYLCDYFHDLHAAYRWGICDVR